MKKSTASDIRKHFATQKSEESKLRASSEMELFNFDETMTEAIPLPGRPEAGKILPSPKKKQQRKVKVISMSQEATAAKAKGIDFSYLPGVMGYDDDEEKKEAPPIDIQGGTTADLDTQAAEALLKAKLKAKEEAENNVTTVVLQSDADEVDRIMKNINTGEDAINFFARYGSDTPLKFVNLMQVEDPKEFRPYDLVIVDLKESQTNVEHFAMSPSGIVHVAPGYASDCVSLANWTRQAMNFRILRKIPFYKYYLHRKTFHAWRNNVRFSLYARQRKKVSDRLFLARHSTFQAILSVKRVLTDVRESSLLQIDNKTSEKDVFIDQQNHNLQEVAHHFEESLRVITREVKSVLTTVHSVHGNAHKSNETEFITVGDTEKAKSLVQLREEKLERKRQRERARHEFGALPDFIRFVDYIVVEFLVQLAVHATKQFYEELMKSRKAGIFEATVRFNSTGTYFSPTSNELIDSLYKLFENMISTVANINRVAYLNSKQGPGGPNIQNIIRENRQYSQALELIKEKITADYERAEEHAISFQPVRPIYDFNLTWDFDAYRAQQHDIASLKQMMEKISNWSKELEKLRNKSVGILDVDSRRLKGELNPIREARMLEIKTYIVDIARERCAHILDHYKECITELNNRPNSLKDYAAYAKSIVTLREDEKKLFKATNTVDQLYKLLSTYEVNVDIADLTLHEDLHDRQTEYRKEFEMAVQYKESKTQEMISNVDVNIQKLSEQISVVVSKLEDPVFVETDQFDEAEKVVEDLVALGQRLENVDQLAQTYEEYQRLFGTAIYEQKELVSGKVLWSDIKTVWELVNKWNDKKLLWMESTFQSLDVEEIDKEVQMLFKEAYGIHKKTNNRVTEKLRDEVSDFKGMMPCVLDLGNPNMRARHWDKVFKSVSLPYVPDMEFPLSQLNNAGVMMYKDLVGEISGTASGEAALEDSLAKIRKVWETTNFIVLNHRDQPGLFVLGSLEEIFTALEDNQVTLQTMLGSRFIADIRESVEEWSHKLGVLSETLDEWVTCQRNWMYLENIFGAEDIQKQLPAESQKFLIVDRSWKALMTQTNNEPLVINAVSPREDGSTLLDSFLTNNAALESVQKSLDEYLETKRGAFPRFYFLSPDELLEILSQTRDPQAVQPHMSKCFDAIKRIKFGEGRAKADILGFFDPAGEYVPLAEAVKAEGAVEYWLLTFEEGMRNALYTYSKNAVVGYPDTEEGEINRAEWLWQFPAQVVISIDQVMWTYNADKALKALESGESTTSMQHFLDFSLQQIDAMVQLVKSDLTKQQRTLMGALLTIDVHARDVTRALVSKRTSKLNDFEWTKQLRYYWAESGDDKEFDVYARQTNTSFRYGYEYLGNGPRLVITPLTDTCYMTLTGALHMKLGGAPAGPAGTGKTETTKDLAKALAVYCVVFNCSDGLDYKIMGRFFSGLAQQGAWACFDEFNRIDIEVLSVIAQQVLCIQQAVAKRAKEFDFEGKMIPLNFAFGVFITMNPGYAGRTELPDNLKALFRPVAMMVPDYRLIAEIMLFAEGFTNALPLSNKMAQLYALSSEQLSKQAHYDFGMRAVKSVLVAAGQLKRKEPETNEDILLIRAMRDSNIPKFLEQDLPLFGGIIKDLFPGITVPFVDYGKLQQAIEAALESMNLQKVPSFITKIIQVHETQLVRHGMMVVGEAGAGKSRNMEVLAKALSTLYEEKVVDRDGFYKVVDRLILNPKSITAGELYGSFNLLTNEWSDGIVPKLVRSCVDDNNNGSSNRKWIIFDGPVDAVWIENMNTVLDDNKTLCLANSERIKLPATLHMMFEVQDLKVASPATVSRCGMVYMEQVHVGVLSLVKTWGQTVLKEISSVKASKSILGVIEAHLEVSIDFIQYNCKEKVSTSGIQLTGELLNLVAAKLNAEEDTKAVTRDEVKMNALIVWCFTWSIGANIVDASRPAFCDFLRERFTPLIGSSPKYACLLEDPYDYFIDLEKGDAKPWTAITDRFHYNHNEPFFSILVPTVDTTRYRYVLEKLMVNGNNVLFMGETGVGKSVIISAFLNDMVSQEKGVSYIMGYSAQTKPSNLKDVFETKLEKKRKTLYGPPSGKKMYMFIDDLNMPALETYGAQPPNELLRQVIDQFGFYDTHKLFFKNVQDVVFCSACAPPGGGRNEVSPRLMRHFHMIWLTNLSTHSMNTIFTSILKGFLDAEAPSLVGIAEKLVESSVNIYGQIQKELLPTPSRSHYTFNLRDLSKVFQGILMTLPKHIPDKEKLTLLWCHESQRVFRDRLIDQNDRDWFNNACLTQLHETLGNTVWKLDMFTDCIYGNYMTRENKEYQELDRSKINNVLMEYLDEYNITFPSRMELVFFRDAINHVSRISRVLSQPRGNALLVGVGGSGRQSLTRMASFMSDYKCRQIEITRGYGMTEWRENVKEILMSAGAKNTPTVFLFSDTQIVNETFLEDINNILNSGEVPNLYEPDELDKIVNMVRPLAKAAGKVETKDGILQHYIYLVRENLHIVLAMSPIGAGFRTRCRMFPSLVNCCTIDWFNAWPEDALFSVAQRSFDEQKQIGIEDYVDSLSTMCNKLHRIVEIETGNFYAELKRFNYTTPTSYLELIKLYISIMKEQREKISGNERRYRNGLDKLKQTEEIVAKLEVEITEMKPVLEQASVDASKLLVQVTADQKDADEQQAVVQVDVDAAEEFAKSVKAIKDDCQADLDEAMPAYEAAVKALKALDKNSITELKQFTNPPEMVRFTMEAVCILLDVKPDWGDAKKLLGAMDFLNQLATYDKDNISKKKIQKLKKYYDDPRFTPDGVKAVSTAAMCLCMWVRAMVVYDRVAKGIEPKKAALQKAEDELAATMATLKVKQDGLKEVLDRVASLQKMLKETQDKKADLEAKADKANKQLVRAGQLLGGLGGEKVRWQESASRLGASMINLVGDMVLAAGCLAYLGPFTSQFRHRIVQQWLAHCKELKIPCSDFNLLHALGDPIVIRKWQIDGLPADDFSCENGLLTSMGRRWPLMIDPQGQANRWIRNMYAANNLQVIKLTEKDFLRTLENGIRYGLPVLLENILQELDPSLEPVLLKQVYKRGGQMVLRLGDTDVPYSDDFRFLITTKLANPHYMPEICIKVTVINFTVTMKGLEDQLLVDVIKNERPDLEEKKDALVVSIAADQDQLRDIENQILQMLAEASGDILDDEELINALAKSKTTSDAINKRLKEAEATTEMINTTREGYRSVATRGSVIYFVVATLALIDPMYQYSLVYFKDLVTQRLQRTEKKEVLQERLDLLIADITKSIYTNVCRGLLEKDKVIFSFVIAAQIQVQNSSITGEEWMMFMVGAVADSALQLEFPFPDTLQGTDVPEKAWFAAAILEKSLPAFDGMKESFILCNEEWSTFLTTDKPHEDKLPGDWEEKLTAFQRLLVVRVFREEKVLFAMKRYISATIGDYFTESPPFDLEGAYSDSTNVSPLIFILSSGADPTDYLLSLAESKGKGDGGLRIISLGQGQGPIAERAIDIAQKTGDWVCLQNCHLAVSWLSRLEQIVEKAQNEPDSVNPDFRLWLTSMPSPVFPVPVLQNGIKITNEPPKGLRANLMRTFNDISSEDYESCSKSYAYKKLLFSTAFFNAIILERRKFGAVGWNIRYEWMNSDLKALMTTVKLYVEEQDEIPWTTLNVQGSEIIYGGRVTDMWDKRTIAAVLKKYFHPSLLEDAEYHYTDDGIYKAPLDGDLDSVKEYLRTLPSDDRPEVFGLHPNAAITFQQGESKSIIETIVLTSGGGGGGGGGSDASNDDKVTSIAVAVEKRMPGLYDVRKAHPESFKKQGDAVVSLGVFLGQELNRFNDLMVVMSASLRELQKAIKGEVVMSGTLENMYNCFVFQKVPPAWEEAGYPCLKPLPAWIEDYFARLDFMGKWLKEGPPLRFWLSGFFFPQGFMTAVKQTYSRDHLIAVDTLKIGCEMSSMDPHDVTKNPEFGAYIYGLFMEGGRFDRQKMLMADSYPRQLFDAMPIVWLQPQLADSVVEKEIYNCPLYKTSLRKGVLSTTGHSTNFVVALMLPTDLGQEYWVRKGCAMLCMLDD